MEKAFIWPGPLTVGLEELLWNEYHHFKNLFSKLPNPEHLMTRIA